MWTVNSLFENYKRNIRRKQAAPDAVGTACRGTHSPKARLFPADLPPANGSMELAVGERSLSPMPCRWGKVVVPDALPLGKAPSNTCDTAQK